MDSKTICDLLADGANLKIKSTPYCVSDLRKMAKAALKGNTTLEIIPGREITISDLNSIVNEAPGHVCFDLREMI